MKTFLDGGGCHNDVRGVQAEKGVEQIALLDFGRQSGEAPTLDINHHERKFRHHPESEEFRFQAMPGPK